MSKFYLSYVGTGNKMHVVGWFNSTMLYLNTFIKLGTLVFEKIGRNTVFVRL